MKCKDCEYCEFIDFDGYYCSKIDAHISDEIVDIDFDCMIYDCLGTYLGVVVNNDGCKAVGVGLIQNIPLSD